jgi:hypothetical protein
MYVKHFDQGVCGGKHGENTTLLFKEYCQFLLFNYETTTIHLLIHVISEGIIIFVLINNCLLHKFRVRKNNIY